MACFTGAKKNPPRTKNIKYIQYAWRISTSVAVTKTVTQSQDCSYLQANENEKPARSTGHV